MKTITSKDSMIFNNASRADTSDMVYINSGEVVTEQK